MKFWVSEYCMYTMQEDRWFGIGVRLADCGTDSPLCSNPEEDMHLTLSITL